MQYIIQNIQNPESSIIVGIIVPIASVLIGAFIGYMVSKSLVLHTLKVERFSNAAFKFKKTFFETIEFVGSTVTFPDDLTDTDTIQYTNDVIAKALPDQRKAMWEFRELLTKDRLGFQNAWNEYTGQDKWEELREFLDEYFIIANFVEYYVENKSEPKEEIKMRELARDRIKKLFEFTKLKYCK